MGKVNSFTMPSNLVYCNQEFCLKILTPFPPPFSTDPAAVTVILADMIAGVECTVTAVKDTSITCTTARLTTPGRGEF